MSGRAASSNRRWCAFPHAGTGHGRLAEMQCRSHVAASCDASRSAAGSAPKARPVRKWKSALPWNRARSTGTSVAESRLPISRFV